MRTKTCDLERAGSTCKLGGNCTKNAERNPCQIFKAKAKRKGGKKDGIFKSKSKS